MNTKNTFQYGNEVGGEKEERRCGQTTLGNNTPSALADPLWSKLREFRIDTPDTTFHFATRLANENGWTPSFTVRVLEEYRRFLFLAMRAGHPVSPSDAVDQAWHLHLLYTESYWGELCPQILGRPFHHGPSKGGAAEDAKFTDWYERTLDSYARYFGQHAPADIWPPIAIRFHGKKHYQRICLNDAWVIRKPRFHRRRSAFAAVSLGTIPVILAEADGDFPLGLVVFVIVVALILIVINKVGRGGGGTGGSGCGGADCGGGGDSGGSSHHGGHGSSDSGGHGGGHSCGGHGCGGGGHGCGGGSSCGGGSCGGGGCGGH
ncbi:conserved hypothetical protein [Chthoniobacter flavus Ellin428]|uniref:TIGR04222 domain-containing membrane protein n=1 Tax=Chthoniobacter flavus Ellin428 TaxID=497964 RepID=B4D3Z5_9BACT|nr:hypothetical protein [Chthoniobacter flavus]EDY18975.1 conserved hypothetical protein [Chthoniobacter flavus Ellin428]TCO93559.1 hypothetical protein EV701_104263 [Chthoniobacter flavus]